MLGSSRLLSTWVRSMSPFDHKLLDIRMGGVSSETFELSIEEGWFYHFCSTCCFQEYQVKFLVLHFMLAICFAIVLQFNFLYRLTFLISGVIMVSVASTLNRSMVFYHSSTMTMGIILVILAVLFQVV